MLVEISILSAGMLLCGRKRFSRRKSMLSLDCGDIKKVQFGSDEGV